MFLARHLERTIGGPDLAWWQLRLALPSFKLAIVVVVGVVTGILAGDLFWIGSPWAAVQVVLVAGFGTGVVLRLASAAPRTAPPVGGIRLRAHSRCSAGYGAWTEVVIGLAAGHTAGVAAGLGGRGDLAGLEIGEQHRLLVLAREFEQS